MTQIFALLFFILLASPAGATQYWANTAGGAASCAAASGASDPGSYRTVAQGMACLSPGDTLVLKAGTYSNAMTSLPRGTSWGLPIKVTNAPGEVVTVTGSTYWGFGGVITRIHTILEGTGTYDNFIIDKGGTSATTGITNGAKSLRLNRVTIKNVSLSNCVSMFHTDAENGRADMDFQLTNSKLLNCGNTPAQDLATYGDSAAGKDHGIYTAGAGILIENNDISIGANHTGWGIHVQSCDALNFPVTVRRNRVHNNGTASGGIHVYCNFAQVLQNQVYDETGAHGGIRIAGTNFKAYNNTVHSITNTGILMGGSSGMEARNNITQSTGGAGIHLADTTSAVPATNTILTNNTTSNSIAINSGSTVATNTNNNVRTVTFVNAAAKDFSLVASSSEIDAGVNVGLPFNGAAPDRGAVEFVGAPSAPGPPTPLSAEVKNATPNVLTLTWTSSTTGVTGCLAANFTVNVATVNRSSTGISQVDSVTTTITFDGAAVTAGQAVLVTYNGTSCQGNSAAIANFSNFAVTNSVSAVTPTPLSAEVKSVTANIVNLIWQTAPNPVTGCLANHFTVSVGGVTRNVVEGGVTQSGNFTTDITFDGAAVTSGQTVLLNYSGTSCTSGGTIAKFTNFAVTNSIVPIVGGFSGATVVTATPNVVNLTFQSTADPITSCAFADFVVNVATVNRTSTSLTHTGPSTVTITFNGAAVTAGQVVTIAYSGTSCIAGSSTIATWTAAAVSNLVDEVVTYSWTNQSFRIRRVRGSDWIASKDLPASFATFPNAILHVIFSIRCTGGPCPALPIGFARYINSGGFGAVLDALGTTDGFGCGHAVVCMMRGTPDAEIPNDGAAITSQLVGTGTFVAGQEKRVNDIVFTCPALATGQECELGGFVQIQSTATTEVLEITLINDVTDAELCATTCNRATFRVGSAQASGGF